MVPDPRFLCVAGCSPLLSRSSLQKYSSDPATCNHCPPVEREGTQNAQNGEKKKKKVMKVMLPQNPGSVTAGGAVLVLQTHVAAGDSGMTPGGCGWLFLLGCF